MLTFVLGILVVVNSGLLAYNTGFLGDDQMAAGREPARMKNQLNAQRIRIEPLRPAPSAVSSTAVNPNAVPVDTIAVINAPSTPPEKISGCIEFGNFNAVDARRFEKQIAPLALGAKLSRRGIQEVERYMVYLRPQSDREVHARRIAQLRQLGVKDFYVLNEGSDLDQAISLGMFRTAEAARQRSTELARQGVADVKVAPRFGAVGKTAFQLRELDPTARNTVEGMKATFPAQEIRACPVG